MRGLIDPHRPGDVAGDGRVGDVLEGVPRNANHWRVVSVRERYGADYVMRGFGPYDPHDRQSWLVTRESEPHGPWVGTEREARLLPPIAWVLTPTDGPGAWVWSYWEGVFNPHPLLSRLLVVVLLDFHSSSRQSVSYLKLSATICTPPTSHLHL